MSSLDMPKFNGCNLIFNTDYICICIYVYTRDYGCFAFLKSRIFFQGRDPASLAPYKEAYRLEAAAEEYSEGGRPGGRPGGAPGKPPKPERLGGKALVFAAAAAAAAAAA